MTFTAEQKSQLARLMATENLTVEHQKIRTAKFDPQNRVLYLPIWKDMTGTTYDHLVGHEVGHALYTPAQGWHDAVVDKSKGKNFKGFLNVVEDARIEKKVKRKYPGLNRSFRESFAALMKQDFFGLRGRQFSDLPFIDRLNLFTKSQMSLPITFSADEQKMVDKVLSAETWDDVVSITGAIFDYSKDEQYEMQAHDFESFGYGDDSEDYSDDYDDYDSDSDGDESDVKSKSQSGESEDSEEMDDDNDGDANGEETNKQSKSKSTNGEDEDADGKSDDHQKEGGNSISRYKDSTPAQKDSFQPNCQTDDSYRSNEVTLLDEKCKEYVYLTWPTPIMENIVTPAKRVQEQITQYYANAIQDKLLDPKKINTWVNDFKNKNDRYIGLLAKEFEMRKAAKSFSKSKLCDTGDIDIGKLAGYKFDDNIFRKVMLTPKGKNHGLVLLLDKSGSMSNNMAGSIEQILVLAMFCRKVNIPFVVYGFGDCVEAHMEDVGCGVNTPYEKRITYNHRKYPSFQRADKAIDMGTVFLREYINSKMSGAEFKIALRNLILLKKSFEGNRWSRPVGRPQSEGLSNTPLTQAIIATASIMKEFKAKNNLDMTSMVIVHDGDSDWTNYYDTYKLNDKGEMNRYCNSIDTKNYNVVIRDQQNKFEYRLPFNDSRDVMMGVALEWFRKVTGSKVFGFFLIPESSPRWVRGTITHRYVMEDGTTYGQRRMECRKGTNAFQEENRIDETVKEIAKKFKQDKFLVSHTHGFNSFYLVVGGDDLKTEDDELEIEGKVTSHKLSKAFMKMNKKKQVSRVLVSKFIQGIAS